jgi:signal transduction histidine kinase
VPIPVFVLCAKKADSFGRNKKLKAKSWEPSSVDEELNMNILLVTGIDGARNCADVLAKHLDTEVEVAEGRKAALAALRQREFAAVVVDETVTACDPAAAEAIWERSGLAIPVQFNFALSGAERLIREIRAALQRREREQLIARRAAAAAVESELKTTLAGLLLQSQLALSSSEAGTPVAERLRMVTSLAGDLRRQLSATAGSR